MRVMGIVLVIFGVLALIYGGFTYTRREEIIDVGPIEASVDRKERVPLPPLVGGAALVAGVLMLTLRRRPA